MLLMIKYNNCWFPVVVSSLSLTVIVPVAAWSGVSTAYTLPTPGCPRSAKQRTNVPQDLGTAARQAGNPTSYNIVINASITEHCWVNVQNSSTTLKTLSRSGLYDWNGGISSCIVQMRLSFVIKGILLTYLLTYLLNTNWTFPIRAESAVGLWQCCARWDPTVGRSNLYMDQPPFVAEVRCTIQQVSSAASHL